MAAIIKSMIYRSVWSLSVLLTGCAVGPAPATAEWTAQASSEHFLVATAEGATETQVPESSGVMASRTSADIFWTHNDSGRGPVVWAFRLSAADRAAGIARRMGSVRLSGASSIDWEDIAAGLDRTIYIFDGGDNPPCKRTNKRIYRFTEPIIDPNGPPVSLTVSSDSIRFEYPDSVNPSQPADSEDERYDAETLFIHPATGDIYVVTKRTNDNKDAARVYKLPGSSLAWGSDAVHVLRFVADLSAKVANWSTGGDIDRTGRRVVIRNYWTAYEFVLPAGQLFDQIFQQTPTVLSLSGEWQGEGICYTRDGGDLVSTSEIQIFGPQQLPFYITPRSQENVRAASAPVNGRRSNATRPKASAPRSTTK